MDDKAGQNNAEHNSSGAEDKLAQKKPSKRLRKALMTSASYGLYAASVYGVYNTVGCGYSDESDTPIVDFESVNYDWQETPEYEAQTKFLKLVFVLLNDDKFFRSEKHLENEATAKIKELEKPIETIYEKARADLGLMLNGEMSETLQKIEQYGSGIAITISYKPNKNSGLENTDEVKVTYSLQYMYPKEVHDGHESQGSIGYASIITWEKLNSKTKKWEKIPVPENMRPMKKTTEQKEIECYYPRWNPQSAKYGFFKKSRLNEWYM